MSLKYPSCHFEQKSLEITLRNKYGNYLPVVGKIQLNIKSFFSQHVPVQIV